MKSPYCFLTVVSIILLPALASAAPEGRLVSAGLFKNGLASLSREITLPEPGEYVVDSLGAPIHGTLWIDSSVAVIARSETREISAAPDDAPPLDLAGALAGQPVTIGFRDAGQAAITGTLLAAPSPAPLQTYASNRDPFPDLPVSSTMYVLEVAGGGRRYIMPDTVAYVEGSSPSNTLTVQKPALILSVPKDAQGPVTVRVTYLARGLSWAPTYRIVLAAPDRLAISQSAVILNELEDLEAVPLELISGFPSIEYQQVTSPFSPGASWDAFFSQLAHRGSRDNAFALQQMITTNNAIALYDPSSAYTTPPVENEGADLHYQSIGAQTLKKGGALTLQVASAEAAYDPVVEWNVPQLGDGQRGDQPQSQQLDMWDAVRFKNPFPFPMTTGPAMVVSGGHFLGSRTTYWANPGEETLAYISKTLSVRAGTVEVESGRSEVTQYHHHYWKSDIEGTLSLENRRSEPVEMLIHKELKGALISADDTPDKVIGQAGPGQVNPSMKLTWRIKLAPGEEREVKYQYAYLVP